MINNNKYEFILNLLKFTDKYELDDALQIGRLYYDPFGIIKNKFGKDIGV